MFLARKENSSTKGAVFCLGARYTANKMPLKIQTANTIYNICIDTKAPLCWKALHPFEF